MNILLTTGTTHAPIDRVRVVTNVFPGKVGAELARTLWVRGHRLTVLSSQPWTLSDLPDPASDTDHRAVVLPFQTYDDLTTLFQREVRAGEYDAVVHAAQVSDYLCAGVYVPDGGTFFSARTGTWEGRGGPPRMTDYKGGKVSFNEPEQWLRLVRAPRLAERVRNPWGFAGLLVDFRQEAGVRDDDLVEIAEAGRARVGAELCVASTREGGGHYAYLGPVQGRYDRVDRRELPDRLVQALEGLHRERRAADA
jgi:phosphopantothenoylcysteine synthetase/decarboxylase